MFLVISMGLQSPLSVAVMVPIPEPEPSHAVEKLVPVPLVLVKRWVGVADQEALVPDGRSLFKENVFPDVQTGPVPIIEFGHKIVSGVLVISLIRKLTISELDV
jgi:hypothetical protein